MDSLSPLPIPVGGTDRVMVLAPHPDDESLPVGGLLRRAASLGGAVRVVYATDGDNNPWAQRAVERRWHIGPEDRRRWARRRRAEAACALRALGVPESAAVFLGLPDQGLTGLLTAGDPGPVRSLVETIEGWRPTVLLAPAPGDLHPDHNGLAVFAGISLELLPAGVPLPVVLRYAVHRSSRRRGACSRRLDLTPAEVDAKRRAILCHASQLTLRRGFMLGFARPVEEYETDPGPEETDPGHPIRRAGWAGRSLVLEVTPPRLEPGPSVLLIAVGGRSRRCVELRLPRRSGEVEVRDPALGLPTALARCRVLRGGIEVVLGPEAAGADVGAGGPWVKVDAPARRRMGLFDRSGWRRVLPCPDARAAAGSPPTTAVETRPALVGPD